MGRQKRKSERNFSRKKRYFAIRFFVKSSLVVFKRFEEIDALRRNCETRALDFFGTAASRLRPRESNERIVFFKKKKKRKKIDQTLSTNGFIASRTFLVLQLHSSIFYAILTTKILHFFIPQFLENRTKPIFGRKRNIFIYFAKDRS